MSDTPSVHPALASAAPINPSMDITKTDPSVEGPLSAQSHTPMSQSTVNPGTLNISTQNLNLPASPLSPTASGTYVPLSPTPVTPVPEEVVPVNKKFVFYLSKPITDPEKQYLTKMFNTVLIYDHIIHANCTTVAQLPSFDALVIDLSVPQIHTFVECVWSEIHNDEVYYTVAVHKRQLFSNMVDTLEALLPKQIIKKFDMKIVNAEVFISTLMKKELPKIQKGIASLVKKAFGSK